MLQVLPKLADQVIAETKMLNEAYEQAMGRAEGPTRPADALQGLRPRKHWILRPGAFSARCS